MLESARVLSAQSGRVLVCMDITDQLLCFANGENAREDEQTKLQLDSLSRLGATVSNDIENSNWYCEEVLRFLRSRPNLRSGNLIRLCKFAIRVAEKRSLTTVYDSTGR